MRAKAHAVRVSSPVVVVAVTKQVYILFIALLALVCKPVLAAVLAPDRADILYHAYDGGGVEVSGPSILVRKGIGNSVSAFGNYYVDNVSSASIDVVTQSGASAYTEERTEYSVGGEYLHDKTTMSLAYTSSSESDYEAETTSFNISMDMFGDLTTVTLGYALGNDVVRSNADLTFEDTIDRRNYRVSVSQVLSKNSILGFIFETITDEGAVSVTDFVASMGDQQEVKGKIVGTVNEVCQAEGCWYTYDLGEGKSMMVMTKDHAFQLPKDCSGKTAVAEGRMYW